MPLDPHALAESVVKGMKSALRAALAPLDARLSVLETRTVQLGPAGRDGVDGKDGAPGQIGQVGPQGERGLTGEQGPRGEKGETGDVGPIGERGLPGERGEKGEPGQAGPQGERGLDGSIGKDGAPGLDGKDGRNGADGLGFDDLDFVYDEHGRLSLRFSRGEIVKSARVPGFVDRGVYESSETYLKGDGVTWGGSFFIAQCDTSTRPESGPEWRLAVKRGREGREGKTGSQGDRGPKGDKGDR